MRGLHLSFRALVALVWGGRPVSLRLRANFCAWRAGWGAVFCFFMPTFAAGQAVPCRLSVGCRVSMPPFMIELHGIEKSFGNLQVLGGIDLHIGRGEVVSIVGPSGAGKTTLLQIMGTLYRPDRGSVRIDGTDVLALGRRELARFRGARLGFVFQFHQLLPEFTAVENVMIPALIAGRSVRPSRERAMQLLDFLKLTDRAAHKPSELSGGEKQRVAVARALINDPAIVLADEPSGSLDSQNKAELHQLFFDLRDRFGQTFVIVTHDEELARLTDRTVHLVDGRIVSPQPDGPQPADGPEAAV